MKIQIICVGKKHDESLLSAIKEYEKRLKPYCDLSWRLIGASSKTEESKAILAHLGKDDLIVLLDETGQQVDNLELSQLIETAQNSSKKQMSLIIGGAYGVDQLVVHRVNHAVSLSRLVFPHQLVRLILVEQLYRSYSILSGGKYHHG